MEQNQYFKDTYFQEYSEYDKSQLIAEISHIKEKLKMSAQVGQELLGRIESMQADIEKYKEDIWRYESEKIHYEKSLEELSKEIKKLRSENLELTYSNKIDDDESSTDDNHARIIINKMSHSSSSITISRTSSFQNNNNNNKSNNNIYAYNQNKILSRENSSMKLDYLDTSIQSLKLNELQLQYDHLLDENTNLKDIIAEMVLEKESMNHIYKTNHITDSSRNNNNYNNFISNNNNNNNLFVSSATALRFVIDICIFYHIL